MANHNKQKKIALINDLTGFGRCSITVQLPIISALKVQCCPIPTAIFSNHPGFPQYQVHDLTDNMPAYMDAFHNLDLSFSGICTGFLGSEKQIQIVCDFIESYKSEKPIIIVDPVMGDHGKPYSTYTAQMCENMYRLVEYADIVTPNVTEACILTKTPYHEHWTMRELLALAEGVSSIGPKKVVITGIPQKTYVSNFCYESNGNTHLIRTHKVGASRSGTGDVFSAIIAADAVNKVPFDVSVKKASRFIKQCILRSIEMEIPLTDGVCFEELLYKLY